MTTYSGNTNSKSIRARRAEREGRFPATRMVELLRQKGLFSGVTAAAIRDAVPSAEWHHTGSFATETNYYSLADIWQARRQLRARIAELRSQPKAEAARCLARQAEWLEWTGMRNHPRATQRRVENIEVTIKGQFVTLHLPERDVRKHIGTRGFSVQLADGRRL